MGKTLLDKVWDLHTVRELPNGQTQLFIGLHLVHEVTSPQAFQMLREKGLRVAYPGRTFATVDHIVPTDQQGRPFLDGLAEEMMVALERNCREFGVRFFDFASGEQGIVHVVGPEQGLTQPGLTVACGDSHTSTHGAFGAIAFGVGTTQIRDILATQTLALARPKVRRVRVSGNLAAGVYAKDVILAIVRTLGVNGGIGFAYEFAGDTIERMSMEERMTVCNMAIEGGARVGYINPDRTTVEFLKGRPYVPAGKDFDRAAAWWLSMGSDPDAVFADNVNVNAAELEPQIAWGINPGQTVGVTERLPRPEDSRNGSRAGLEEAYRFTSFEPGQEVRQIPINVAFIGSCTNGRMSDLREAARVAKGRRVAGGVKAIVVPGSQKVQRQAEKEGLPEVFRAAGFEWRNAGCSMCLAMNPDKLKGREICASSSNRNFIGRQGSPTGRTLLMSPAMVAAAAIHGRVSDVREML
ncbi:MAG TPA: 3-isopropylmalate dehydratase large subunit [Elusimicrobiota bacterium]|nr:3-isopropylmalate dehydratase large subunit [Elusimicrobiota bacterium]